VECAEALRDSIVKIASDPTAALKGSKKVEVIEDTMDEGYLNTKSMLITYADQMNCGAIVIFDDLIEFIEYAADMCADTADYIVTLASGA
jgi:uncharacterized protein Yka (UPF0111/DUF47 family)